MAVTLSIPQLQLLKRKVHTMATCWSVVRTDGVILRFTDHDTRLTVDDATFEASGGFNATARQKQVGLKTRNVDLVGVLATDAITNDDLRAGLYRECMITERMVDWRYPHVGSYLLNRYWLSELTYTANSWEAKVDGITRWLRGKVGDVYTRLCRYDLGDLKCTIDLGAITEMGVVTAINSQRYLFETDLGAFDNDFFSNGLLTWLSGANADIPLEVSAFDTGTGKMRLHLATPYDIQVGDTFEVYPGCNKKFSTCIAKFANSDNFGGQPDLPGTDAMLQTPRSV